MSTSGDPIYFKAVLRPNPPLSTTACVWLIAAVAAMNLAVALVFVLRGAWPVTPFMGADVVFLAWAFISSSKAAKRREEFQLTSCELGIDFYSPRGELRHVGFNPYWVRVELDERLRGRRAITLASHGRRLQIGTFLSPHDRSSFATALRRALSAARRTS